MEVLKQANDNLNNRLAKNTYPGRGIVLGLNRSGDRFIQVYWIMGRSANSRNRVFKLEDDILKTWPKDPAKVADPSLIIYNAMRHTGKKFIVTNGVQTDTIWKTLENNGTLEDALEHHTYEPDAPNFTPRISGLIDFANQQRPVQLAIIKKSPWNDGTVRQFFNYPAVAKGLGLCIHTYENDGDPLPPFSGEPYLVPLGDSPREIASLFWHHLDRDNKISLAVKAIPLQSDTVTCEIINRYESMSLN